MRIWLDIYWTRMATLMGICVTCNSSKRVMLTSMGKYCRKHWEARRGL